MLTIEALKEFGADTEQGLQRCRNKKVFYIKIVGMGIQDKNFDELKPLLEAKDFGRAFEVTHALKGVLGNLALTPILEPVEEMTEALRARKDIDYMPLYEKMMERLGVLRSLAV